MRGSDLTTSALPATGVVPFTLPALRYTMSTPARPEWNRHVPGLFLVLLPDTAGLYLIALRLGFEHADTADWTVGYGPRQRETLQAWTPPFEAGGVEDVLAAVRRLFDEVDGLDGYGLSGGVLMLDPYTTEVSPTAEADGLAQGLDVCHVGLVPAPEGSRPSWYLTTPWGGRYVHALPSEEPERTMWVILDTP